MIELQDIKLEDIKNLALPKEYNLVYLDYNNRDGKKKSKDINTLSDENLKNMYKLYIFNDDSMITVYNFGNEYKYSKIDREDFEKEDDFKFIYLKESDKDKYKNKSTALNIKLKVRIGKLKENEKREVIQYIGYVGGEK